MRKWADEVLRERGKRGWDEVDGSGDRAGPSGEWASGETAESPALWARQPLATVTRHNPLFDPSPELGQSANAPSPDLVSLTRAPSHTTLVPATPPASALPPSLLLSPAWIGPSTSSFLPPTGAKAISVLATATKPPAETRERRAALTRALQRSLKGLLGPCGVIPFREGDERLGGCAPLGAAKRTRVDGNGVGTGGWVATGEEEETWGSFKTVPPTPEQLRRK